MADPIYMTVQPGFEAALEAEVLAAFPGGRVSESLSGWRVFEVPGQPDTVTERLDRLIFARSWGWVIHDESRSDEAPGSHAVFREPFVLQCWHRRTDLPGAREKRPVLVDVELKEQRVREELLLAGLSVLPEVLPAQAGARVVNIIRVTPDRWLWGWHRHCPGRLPFAGAEYPWPQHPVPSRAYLKCREALELTGASLSEGELAIELGAAPGGALLALLERGLDVLGVDPAPLAPEVLVEAGRLGRSVTHLRTHAETLRPENLPERVAWLFSDMNVSPAALTGVVGELLPLLQGRGLRGIFLTVKLTDLKLSFELGEMARRLGGKWGIGQLRFRQLSQNRREVLLYGSLLKSQNYIERL